MKLHAVSQINEMFKIVGYHIPLDSLSNLERKNAACSKLNIPNVSSKATCFCFSVSTNRYLFQVSFRLVTAQSFTAWLWTARA